MTAYVLPQVDTLSCTIVEGNGRETEVTLPMHPTKGGQRWIAASPVKMDQHGTFYIYALFLDPALVEPSPDEPGSHRYKEKLKRRDAVPFFELEEI